MLSRPLRDRLVGVHDILFLLGAFRSEPSMAHAAAPQPSDTSPGTGPDAGYPLTDVAPVVPHARSLREAIRWTVLYSSIFDYPLTRDEVYRFLMAPGGLRAEVEVAIDDALASGDGLETDGLFLYPAGRSDSVTTRVRRGPYARQAWRRARFYARLIWALPYVRMVAITGALAMNNVEQGDDIDFLIVTNPGRLWMTRGMILILARLARAWGDTLCPNYIISSRALQLEQRDPYAAHELAQMVPLHGKQVAERLWTENVWCRDYLPNVWWRGDEGVDDGLPWILTASKALAQAVLDLPLGTLIERWEQRRKIAQLSRDAPPHPREIFYTADVCKGHADSHGSRILDRWAVQVAQQSSECDACRPGFNGVALDPAVDLK